MQNKAIRTLHTKITHFLTSSLRIISTCNRLWYSSHSSLYFSISSFVWRIFFFKTSKIVPCCMFVVILIHFCVKIECLNANKQRHLRPTRENANWQPRSSLLFRIVEMGSARTQPANKMAATELGRYKNIVTALITGNYVSLISPNEPALTIIINLFLMQLIFSTTTHSSKSYWLWQRNTSSETSHQYDEDKHNSDRPCWLQWPWLHLFLFIGNSIL